MLNEESSSLLGAAFTVGTAHRAGWTRGQVDDAAYERPFHGVRVARTTFSEMATREGEHLRLAMAFAPRMGDHEFLSHISAALTWAMPVPMAVVGTRIDVAVFTPDRHPRGRNVRGHEVARHLARTVEHPELGVRVAAPASAWAMLGAVIRDPYDLVAAGDAVVRAPQHPRDPPALCTVADLLAAITAGRRVGINALREALPRIRTGSSSRPETWTRLTLVDAGLPEPALAHEVFDAAGRLIARVDLAYPQVRIALEYEGEQHLTDVGQWTKDIARYERLAAEGWTVLRITKNDLFTHPRSLVARVRRALAAAT